MWNLGDSLYMEADMSRLHRCSYITALVSILLMSALPSLAQVLETPIVSLTEPGTGKQPVVVTAGRSGAPGGFTVWWVKEQDFIANGSQWFPPGDPRQKSAHFWGTPTLNVFDGENPDFTLPPLTLITVELGDVADETGVDATSVLELDPGTAYVLCVFANAHEGMEQSAPTLDIPFSTRPEHECLFTQGYWKNHWDAWPLSSLLLGNVSYDQDQLLSILHQPVQGNGIISLAHQLIATKLNIALGADAVGVIEAVLAADDLIGDLVVPPIGSSYLHPSSTSSLTQTLDDFNNDRFRSVVECVTDWCCTSDHICFPTEIQTCEDLGGMVIGPEDCDIDYTCDFPTPVNNTTWGTLRTIYR
jgi:hypothetical protein